ncbi:MAG: O-antigen ligase family protein, partial [Beijerinckiaceae bacterium]
ESALPRSGVRLHSESLLRWVFGPFLFCGCIAVIEPSPSDLLSLLFLPLLIFSGFKIYRLQLPILILWILYIIAGFLALMPHWGETDPTMFQFQSLYLVITFVMFLVFLSENTEERSELALKAFTAGCIFSALIGIAGFLNVAGLKDTITVYEGRVTGLFKDPNVFGSYMIMGAIYLLQILVLGIARRFWLTFAAYVIVMLGIFLSFSRGSIGATLFGTMMIFGLAFVTSGSARIRRRVLIAISIGLVLAAAGIAIALSIEEIRKLVELRFNAVQDYDGGYTGRFGNQIRSLPMMLDLPLGFGPLRYRLTFALDPHSSYINAFASYGWLGGFSWFIIVGWTCFIGFRLMFVNSPYRVHAQVWFVSLFVLLLQAFQIDIDHWRWIFLGFAGVWALEVARVRWLNQQLQQTGADQANT